MKLQLLIKKEISQEKMNYRIAILNLEKLTYLIRKYTPNNLSKMDIYLERLDELVRFYDGDCDALNHLPDFLFVDKVEGNTCGELVYSQYNFYIYEKFS